MFTTMITMLAQVAATTVTSTVPVKAYFNNRYGYTVCYPVNFRPQPESTNGDGRIFRSRDGAEMTVWGSLNVSNQSLLQYTDSYNDSNEHVTYRVNRPTWTVRSGINGNQIFWRKSFKRSDDFVTLNITYPLTYKRSYDPLVKTLSSCFRPGISAF